MLSVERTALPVVGEVLMLGVAMLEGWKIGGEEMRRNKGSRVRMTESRVLRV